MVTSCISVVQCHTQEADVDTIHSSCFDFTSYLVHLFVCVCVCVCVSHVKVHVITTTVEIQKIASLLRSLMSPFIITAASSFPHP